MIQCCVTNAAGDQVHFGLEQDCKLSAIKDVLAERWSVPPCCQHLVCGTELLLDDEQILDRRLYTAQSLHLSMLVSVGALISELDGEFTVSQKLLALKNIQALKEKAGEPALGAVLRRLEDKSPVIREAAVQALGMVTKTNDEYALAALLAYLDHWHAGVRAAALQALARIAEPGNDRVLAAIARKKEDVDRLVREEALKAACAFIAT